MAQPVVIKTKKKRYILLVEEVEGRREKIIIIKVYRKDTVLINIVQCVSYELWIFNPLNIIFPWLFNAVCVQSIAVLRSISSSRPFCTSHT